MRPSKKPHPRLRMFAGPNGSGKSIIKAQIQGINEKWIGVHVNPDEIEAVVKLNGFLDFGKFGFEIESAKLRRFLSESTLLKRINLQKAASQIEITANKIRFESIEINSYFASVLSDFIRHGLIATGKDLSFETVMSSPDKLDFLDKAGKAGYRNYLYYIATEDPVINVSRVEYRVKTGGHDVPIDKIRSRYYRSLDMLLGALKLSDRAFIFDNSGSEAKLIAEISDQQIEIKNSIIPTWFKKYVLDRVL